MAIDVRSIFLPYGLTESLASSPVTELTEGSMNRSWRVGGYVVKQVLDVGLEETRRQHAATKALSETGFPVPPPLDPLLVNDDGIFQVVPFMDGVHRKGDAIKLDECEALGAFLGRLHLALSDVMPPPQLSVVRKNKTPEDALESLTRYAEVIESRANPDEFDDYARRMIDAQIRLLRANTHRRPSDQPIGPIGWIHGDFNPQNLLWQDTELNAVIDWDRLQVAHLGHEPVRAASLFFDRDLVRIGRFLQGYRAIVHLSDDELADVVHRRWWDGLTSTWPLNLHYDKGSSRCDRFFYGSIERQKWWTEHYDALLDAAGCESVS